MTWCWIKTVSFEQLEPFWPFYDNNFQQKGISAKRIVTNLICFLFSDISNYQTNKRQAIDAIKKILRDVFRSEKELFQTNNNFIDGISHIYETEKQ